MLELKPKKNQEKKPTEIKVYAGVPCKTCGPHAMRDHSMYSPRHCYIENCDCKDYKADIPLTFMRRPDEI